jgi:ketosteroid isomerase-like protein
VVFTLDRVREIFKGLENGNGGEFFTHVADDVDWTVEGTHPLASRYRSKAEFLAHTFEKLAQVLRRGAQMYVENAFTTEIGSVLGRGIWPDQRGGRR